MALNHIEEIENNGEIFSSNVMDEDTSYSEKIYELKWYKSQALLGLRKVKDARDILIEISGSNSKHKRKG